MDLAIGAKKTFVMMDYLTKAGEAKLVPQCSYPLTGMACVSRIYSDLALIDIGPQGPVVAELAPGLTLAVLQALTPAVRLLAADALKEAA
jgi:3-oxoadipate CoA-transferase beta subunit